MLTFEPEEFKDARAPVPKVTSDGLVYSSAAKCVLPPFLQRLGSGKYVSEALRFAHAEG